MEQEQYVVGLVSLRLEKWPFLTNEDLCNIEYQYRDELASNRKAFARLFQAKCSLFWFPSFLKRNYDKLSSYFAHPVGQLCTKDFNAEILTFFEQVELFYRTFNIKATLQVDNFDEIGFYSGSDLSGKKGMLVVTYAGVKST